MERSAAATTASSEFVRWEEVNVSTDKGRREVHFYLKRRDGTSDLAIIGKEKSLRHISYHYASRGRSILRISPSSSLLKLRSRREVVDWLDSVVEEPTPYRASDAVGGSSGRKSACELDTETQKDIELRKLGHRTAESLWIGSPWTCRKRRRHYESFQRNGVKISVHDFVYVLAEEGKRLVAYLEDLYEDSRGNKMVVVRWFHKIDEVGIFLPQNYNDREIFFSLCLQDLNIECIDGLATVLSPHHYMKFLTEAKDTRLEPFVCHRQFDNDEVKPFDITQVKDYWRQEIVRHMHTASHSKYHVKSQPAEDGLKIDKNLIDGVGSSRPKKRLRRSKDGNMCLPSAKNQESLFSPCLDMHDLSDSLVGSKGASVSVKQDIMQKIPQHLTIGSQVEVLSQDSGLRGCWFRALIIKKHKEKVKLQYQDIKDAADEDNNLEEWVLASKIAVPDLSGLRLSGRTTIRPTPPSTKGNVSLPLNAGAVVDVWWHQGWWEGIILQKETEDKIRVYFPGEKRESVFGSCELRHSQEWLGNGWKHMKERPDVVTSVLCELGMKQNIVKACDAEPGKFVSCNGRQPAVGIHKHSLRMKQNVVKTCDAEPGKAVSCNVRQPTSAVHKHSSFVTDEVGYRKSHMGSLANKAGEVDKASEIKMVRDLSKDVLLAQLKWKTLGKRRRGNSAQTLLKVGNGNKSNPQAVETPGLGNIFVSKSLKVDHDNCKYIGDSPFSSSVVPPLTSLVMSR